MKILSLRVLEFGPLPLVKTAYPAETVFVSIGADPVADRSDTSYDLSPDKVRRTLTLLNDPTFDAIFVSRPSTQRRWYNTLVRLIFNRRIAERGVPALRVFGDRLLRLGAKAPLIVFDPSDATFAASDAIWLWRKAAVVFKRELPLDPWQMFALTVHGDLPTPRFRRKARYRALVAKARPMSLGLTASLQAKVSPEAPEKTVDIFFAGHTLGNSWLREKGTEELAALRASDPSITIDVAEEMMPHDAFLRRCARARLVWSPAGLGHDTFRHYEAAVCGSVPLISRPTILQYAPFKDGDTAFFSDPEGQGLTAAVRRALDQRGALGAMGMAARAHVLTHHTVRARVDHMLAAVSAGGV